MAQMDSSLFALDANRSNLYKYESIQSLFSSKTGNFGSLVTLQDTFAFAAANFEFLYQANLQTRYPVASIYV